MSEITKPIALDESLHTTEPTPRNLADVLSDELQNLATAISGGSDKVPKTDIATVEPTNTASRAYSVGELVYVNGNLYKVITAIASGATFTVGTNIQSTNVSGTVKDALDELSSATKNGNAEFATLINNTDTTITRNALLVVIASVQENTQYGGYSVYINGLYVDGIGNVGLSNPAQTFTKSFHVNKGDVVKVVFNTAQGTTGTAKLYI